MSLLTKLLRRTHKSDNADKVREARVCYRSSHRDTHQHVVVNVNRDADGTMSDSADTDDVSAPVGTVRATRSCDHLPTDNTAEHSLSDDLSSAQSALTASTSPVKPDESDAIPVIEEDVHEVVAEEETNVKHLEQAEDPSSVPRETQPKILMRECSATPDHCDIFIITSDDDLDNAGKLASVLTKFCNLTVHPELGLGENRLDHLRSGLARSNYRFIFIDDSFEENDLVKFGADAALMEMINRRDQSIIPVKAHADIAIPPLLRMFRSLDVQKLLCGKRLDDVDVDSLTEDDIEKPLLATIIRMVTKSAAGMLLPGGQSPRQSPRMSPQHPDILRQHYNYLVDKIDPDSGLLGDLFSTKVISHREMETIRAEKTAYDRNEYLIKILMKKSEKDFQQFLEVLSKDQSHVADIIRQSLDR